MQLERNALKPIAADLTEEERQQCFDEGKEAGRLGLQSCPYEHGQLVMWLRGFHIGKAMEVRNAA